MSSDLPNLSSLIRPVTQLVPRDRVRIKREAENKHLTLNQPSLSSNYSPRSGIHPHHEAFIPVSRTHNLELHRQGGSLARESRSRSMDEGNPIEAGYGRLDYRERPRYSIFEQSASPRGEKAYLEREEMYRYPEHAHRDLRHLQGLRRPHLTHPDYPSRPNNNSQVEEYQSPRHQVSAYADNGSYKSHGEHPPPLHHPPPPRRRPDLDYETMYKRKRVDTQTTADREVSYSPHHQKSIASTPNFSDEAAVMSVDGDGKKRMIGPRGRTSRYLSEGDRRAILSRIEKGERQAALAKEYNVSRAAICNLYKNREEVLFRSDRDPNAKHPKRLRKRDVGSSEGPSTPIQNQSRTYQMDFNLSSSSMAGAAAEALVSFKKEVTTRPVLGGENDVNTRKLEFSSENSAVKRRGTSEIMNSSNQTVRSDREGRIHYNVSVDVVAALQEEASVDVDLDGSVAIDEEELEPLQIRELCETSTSAKILFSLLRSSETPSDEFRHAADRLIHLLMEEVLLNLPKRIKSVRTPSGDTCEGIFLYRKDRCCAISLEQGERLMLKKFSDIEPLVATGYMNVPMDNPSDGVGSQLDSSPSSVSKTGSASESKKQSETNKPTSDTESEDLEPVVKERKAQSVSEHPTESAEMEKDGSVGKIKKTEVCHLIPSIPSPQRVFVFDIFCKSGEKASAAIDTLLRKLKVDESDVCYVTLLGSAVGFRKLQKAFPNINLITAQVDNGLDSLEQIRPGIGDFYERYGRKAQ